MSLPQRQWSSMEEVLGAIIRESLDASLDARIDKLRQLIESGPPASVAAAPTKKLEPTYTTAEAAAHLHLTEPTVAGYCRSGELRAQQFGRRWVVSHSALEEFKAKRRREPRQSAEQPNEAADRALRHLQRRS